MKTRKSQSSLVLTFLRMLNVIKLFHWNTNHYAKHKATDDLHQKLSELIDSYVEKYSGEMGRIQVKGNASYKELSDDEFMKEIKGFSVFLTKLHSPSTDLDNIRDEMLGEVNQFLYLWTLK
jgi:hypothetical protein